MDIFNHPPANASDEWARNWLNALWDSPYRFHIDDDASDIGNTVNGRWVPTFTEQQAQIINDNLEFIAGRISWDAAWNIYYKDDWQREGEGEDDTNAT